MAERGHILYKVTLYRYCVTLRYVTLRYATLRVCVALRYLSNCGMAGFQYAGGGLVVVACGRSKKIATYLLI